MGISVIAIAVRYWWAAAIAILFVALKIQTSRLHGAAAAEAVLNARIAEMTQQNHGLKAASDECNDRVERMRQEGQSLQASLEQARHRADAVAAAGTEAAADTMAHPPADNCESILRYGHEEAARFKW
jgi:cell division protein FtsB